MEAVVRQARETFGDTLPQDFLSQEEYLIYERLYGPPSATTLPEDVDLLQGFESPENDEKGLLGTTLMKENADGELEEIIYEEEPIEEVEEEYGPTPSDDKNDDFQHRVANFRALAAANSVTSRTSDEPSPEMLESNIREANVDDGNVAADQELEIRELEENDDVNDPDDKTDGYEDGDSFRTHPLTAAGHFGTSPSTIQISKETFVEPITALLSDASNKQLVEVSEKTFGGPGLPSSTATISRPNLKQEPIALEASQFKMGEMEGNVYLAAIMPGAYASIMSTLVETRKRLGSEWLRDLLQRPDGPRILDAGAGGAGVLAWREIMRTEWELMHPRNNSQENPVPNGRSTVVVGSAALRNRASHLLDNTTFIPRVPDYDASRDHPSLEQSNPQPRKQYDIIVAPYTLWTLKEDYMRKNQVQNFWSLLDPKGGVLILLEKGVPRGFELIADARETLLRYHIASPGSVKVEHTVDDVSENRFGPKEKGMIIAPCTNHGKCPMSVTAGTIKARKDFCHFSQRFIRPPFLQRILGYRKRNNEDISFSYVALQRGVDQREIHNIVQGLPATDTAFTGYEEADSENEPTKDQVSESQNEHQKINPLSFPRAILPPIKRRGHVILDLCTPAGKIERWTVPKSFSKQAYRDARKSKWGDLWALGAKTRVPRKIRVGPDERTRRRAAIPGQKRAKRAIKAAAENMDDMQDVEDVEDAQDVPDKRNARVSFSEKPKDKRKRKMLENNYSF